MNVKELIWSKDYPPDNSCRYNHILASTHFGSYLISWKGWKDRPEFSVEFDGEWLHSFYSLDEAKSYCQSDFKDLVEGCLE